MSSAFEVATAAGTALILAAVAAAAADLVSRSAPSPGPSVAVRYPAPVFTAGAMPGARTLGAEVPDLNAPIPVLAIHADGGLEVDGRPVPLTKAQRQRLARYMTAGGLAGMRPPATRVWYGARPLVGPRP